MSRLVATVGLDALIAEKAALLDAAQEPFFPSAERMTHALTGAQLDDLGPRLEDAAVSLLEDIAGFAGTSRVQSHRAGQPSVRPVADRILAQAEQDLVRSATAAIPFSHQAKAFLGGIAGDAGRGAIDGLAKLHEGVRGLKRLGMQRWHRAIDRLLGLLRHDAKAVRQAIPHPEQLADEAARGVLARMLQVEGVIMQADVLLTTHLALASAALDACDEVERHYRRRRRAVPHLQKALPWIAAIHTVGTAFAAVGTGALLLYSFWTAHDHLDSPLAARLRLTENPGILTAVQNVMP
jgi:hypothetical protein